MSSKSRGCEYERKLVHLLRKMGFTALRVAGSGSMPYPLPDIVASDGKRVIAIEVKSSRKNCVYLRGKDLNNLLEFSSSFGAEPFFAIHTSDGWFFKKAEELIGKKVLKLDKTNTHRQI